MKIEKRVDNLEIEVKKLKSRMTNVEKKVLSELSNIWKTVKRTKLIALLGFGIVVILLLSILGSL